MVASIVYSIDELREYAAKAGLGLQFVVKEAFLFELLELLDEQGFVLKGGTAINKCYLQGHQRFSEDLDYDTAASKESIKKFMRQIGWPIKKEFFTKRSIGFLLGYEFNGVKDVVKADFSFNLDGKYEKSRLVSDFLPISKRTNVYTLENLIGQKERAFETRHEWKDLYDLYWLSSLYPNKFRIANRNGFTAALASISVPKTANSFIPLQKRLNWDEVKEALGR
ncbi:MAG: nucleotidyl transferase AbiEii/AbiGii toxin family protein [Candidatus Micrarchaeales archaeon]